MDKKKCCYTIWFFNGTSKMVTMTEKSTTKPMTEHEFNKHLKKRKSELSNKGRFFCINSEVRW